MPRSFFFVKKHLCISFAKFYFFFSCFVEKHCVTVSQTVEEIHYHQTARETAVSIRMDFPTMIMELVDLA